MGLFGSTKKTIVAVQGQRVIEDKVLPNSAKSGVIKAIMLGENISDHVMDSLINSIGVKSERMYKYGKDKYVFGLPSSNISSPTKGHDKIQAYLNKLEGKTVSISYLHYGAYNWFYAAWLKLHNELGYKQSTNEVTFRIPGVDVNTKIYLDGMLAKVFEATMANNINVHNLDLWGADPSDGYTPERPYTGIYGNMGMDQALAPTLYSKSPYIQILSGEVTESVVISLVYKEVKFDPNTENTTTTYPKYNITVNPTWSDNDHYMAKYVLPNGEIKYWTYEQGAGIEELDRIFYEPDNSVPAGSFFPYVYFRYDKTNPLGDKQSAEFKSSKKICKYLGMKYEDVVDAIHENPDIKDVEQAILMYVVPAGSKDQKDLQYIYAFFDGLHKQSNVIGDNMIDIGSNMVYDGRTRKTIVIQDKRFKQTLGFNYIKKVNVSITGKPGECSSGTGFDNYSFNTMDSENQQTEFSTKIKYHWYRKQITETLGYEIRISNLQMTYHIWGGYTDTANDEEEHLYIPVDRAICRNYTIKEKEQFYSRSLHYIFTTRQIVKVKWYQKSWFKAFMIVVAIVLTIITLGAAAQSLVAAAAAGTAALVAAINTMVIGFLKYMATLFAMNLFVKAVGGELALMVAIVAMAYGMYDSGISSAMTLNSSNSFVNLAQTLIKSVSEFYSDAMSDIQRELASITEDYKESMKTIETAKELLENQNILSPYIIFGESPSQFYTRTLGAPMLNTLSLELPHTYVETSLTLPGITY